jgi:hypothetical protein
MITKTDLKVAVTDLRSNISRIKTELTVWVVGTVGLSVLINHFWR